MHAVAGYCRLHRLCVIACASVCVGGVLFMGKVHDSVITLIYGPQLPHLTKNNGSPNQGISHSNTHMNLHIYKHSSSGDTLDSAAYLSEVLKAGMCGHQFAERDWGCVRSVGC